MNPQQAILDHYESIADVSQLMLAAACRNDWEALIDAEECCASLIARLKVAGVQNAALDERSRERKHVLIRRVLADDAQIREHTQPWLRQLGKYLGQERTARSLEVAYRP